MRVLFAGGGSIGHIAPCIAVWREVQKRDAAAATHFVCSDRREDIEFLEKEGIDCTALGSRRIRIWKFPGAFFKARTMLRVWRPDIVFTKGGGVTIPTALAAWTRGIPLVVHESDAVPGRATSFLSRFATRVIQGFTAGNPVRESITQGSRETGLRLTGLSGSRPILLVTGGSQGAVALNTAIATHLDEVLAHVDIVHITGEGKSGALSKSGYWSRPFVHDELPHLYAIADIALARAGAGSISELAANGIATVLVPLEGVAHDHQLKNAEAAASGGCIVLRQARLHDELVPTIVALAQDADQRRAMGEKMRHFGHVDAAASLAQTLFDIVKRD
jgi:UDP-N-acetylglucosamine--N-acetylmuramyl-(pentapeptide) pyrophosphoryl-undecaprenol N-acetylglucosamine transferase